MKSGGDIEVNRPIMSVQERWSRHRGFVDIRILVGIGCWLDISIGIGISGLIHTLRIATVMDLHERRLGTEIFELPGHQPAFFEHTLASATIGIHQHGQA